MQNRSLVMSFHLFVLAHCWLCVFWRQHHTPYAYDLCGAYTNWCEYDLSYMNSKFSVAVFFSSVEHSPITNVDVIADWVYDTHTNTYKTKTVLSVSHTSHMLECMCVRGRPCKIHKIKNVNCCIWKLHIIIRTDKMCLAYESVCAFASQDYFFFQFDCCVLWLLFSLRKNNNFKTSIFEQSFIELVKEKMERIRLATKEE